MTVEEQLYDILMKTRADLERMESKMDEVLKLRANLEALVEFIPNPIIRKIVKSKISS
jgi:hypothetical protein